MKIYDNSSLKSHLKQYVAAQVTKLQTAPRLHIIQIGDEFASNTYIEKKKAMGQQLGIEVFHHHFRVSASPSVVQTRLDSIAGDGEGVIVQLPVPAQFQPIVDAIPWQIDVDLLSPDAGRCWATGMLPPTISAIDLVLKDMLDTSQNSSLHSDFFETQLDLRGTTVAVIGQGVLVGNPLLKYLRDREATIISINKDTRSPQSLVCTADVVITGAGVPGLIDSAWLKEGVMLIDAATSESNNTLVGDVDYTKLPDSGIVCKSPGGVGPLTVLCLFLNTVKLDRFDRK